MNYTTLLLVMTLAQQAGEPARTMRQAGETKRTSATVTAVDQEKRTLTLKTDDGKTKTVAVPEEVRRLDRIQKGDRLNLTYTDSIALAVRRRGEATPETKVKEQVERTEGARPAGTVERQVTMSAEVTSVDPDKGTLGLKGPEGKVEELTVKDPQVRQRLANLKKGDVIEVTYIEAVAVELEPRKK